MKNYSEIEKAILDIPNLKDMRGKLPTWNTIKKDLIESGEVKKRYYRKRNLADILYEAIHHSLTFSGSPEAFARYHVNHNGWPGIGYHFVIEEDKDEIVWCWDLDVRAAHVGNSNTYAIGTCLIGDFRTQEPKDHQLQNAANLSMVLIDYLPTIKEIKAHQDFPGYSWKECPAFDVMKITNRMKAFRK
jgi:N-acetyl-anhydromuramyl-L-alanine amidase AmpD